MTGVVVVFCPSKAKGWQIKVETMHLRVIGVCTTGGRNIAPHERAIPN
jgi:hypothetical protein